MARASVVTKVSRQRACSDYLDFLLMHTMQDVHDRVGYDVWGAQNGRAEVVFSHPGHWVATEREVLQKAAATAGLVPPDSTVSHLHLVPEPDAFASFALQASAQFRTELQVCNGSMSVNRIPT